MTILLAFEHFSFMMLVRYNNTVKVVIFSRTDVFTKFKAIYFDFEFTFGVFFHTQRVTEVKLSQKYHFYRNTL